MECCMADQLFSSKYIYILMHILFFYFTFTLWGMWSNFLGFGYIPAQMRLFIIILGIFLFYATARPQLWTSKRRLCRLRIIYVVRGSWNFSKEMLPLHYPITTFSDTKIKQKNTNKKEWIKINRIGTNMRFRHASLWAMHHWGVFSTQKAS
jgi:hypothetical protein